MSDHLTKRDADNLLSLIHAGTILSNLAYNAAQDTRVPNDWRDHFLVWWKSWDNCLRRCDLNKLRDVSPDYDPCLHGA